MKFKRRLAEDDEAVPMSSMADIAFLLIIFFMLTTVFAVDSGIVIELPDTEVRESVPLREVVITVTSEGNLYADGKPLELENVGGFIRAKRSANPSRPVVVKSDRRVSYGLVADVMDELLKAGVRDVALPTVAKKPEDGK